MSTKTGVAPARTTEFATAANVNDGTITSSPGPTPEAIRPSSCPLVPELTATAVRPLEELVGELRLERGDLRALGEHPAAQYALDSCHLLVADERFGCGNECAVHGGCPSSASALSSPV